MRALTWWENASGDERRAKLKEIIASGEVISASVIAERLGAPSRNAILGLAHRMKVKLPIIAGSNQSKRVATKGGFNAFQLNEIARARNEARAAARRAAYVEQEGPPMEVDTRSVSKAAVWAPMAGTRPRPLHECKDAECSWPLYDNADDGTPHLFCGEVVVAKRAYCLAHYKASIGDFSHVA